MKFFLIVCLSLVVLDATAQSEGHEFPSPSGVAGLSPDSSHHYFWDNQDETWFLNSRVLNTNDTEGKIITSLTLWDESGWVNKFRNQYVYDAQDNILIDLQQYWSSDHWRDGPRHVRTFDQANNRTSEIFQGWNGVDWSNYDKDTFLFNPFNQLLVRTNFTWYMGWIWDRRYTYSYDGNQNLFMQARDYFYEPDSTWRPEYRILYTHSLENTLDSDLTQVFQDSTWRDESRNLYTYDDHQQRTMIRHQIADMEGSWINDWQRVYTYNANGNITGKINQSAQDTGWLNNNRYLYEYNTQQQLISISYQWWAGDWVNRDSTHYFYSPATSGLESDLLTRIQMYPNPAEEAVTLVFKQNLAEDFEVRVYTSSGVLILQRNHNAGALVHIDIDQWLPGMYYVLVQGNHSQWQGTFIKS